MTATEFFQVIAGLPGPLFVMTSILAMGMSLATAHMRRPIAAVCRVVDRP
jgi:hypothetical protein